MKKITVATYQDDTYYPRVVKAMVRVLKTSDEIAPIAVLLEMGNLEPQGHECWRRGQVPYLERVFHGSLSKANRILRIIGFVAHDLNLVPVQREYRQTGAKAFLRFSKSGDPNLEKAYARHFRWNQSQEKKHRLIRDTSSPQAILIADKTSSGSSPRISKVQSFTAKK